MKFYHVLFLLATAFFIACGDDDSGSTSNILKYDGENSSSPELDAGDHELAVYFPASTMAEHVGKKLIEVDFYAGFAPQVCNLVIHGPGTSTSPGNALQTLNVTNLVQGDSRWVTKILDTPIEITGEDLWIGLFVTHTETKQTIGCDAGPRQAGGDWIWSSDTQTWETFFNRTGTESVNWNIRGVLEE